MQRILGLAVIAIMLGGGAGAVAAQQQPPPTPAHDNGPTMEQGASTPVTKPWFSILGFQVGANAPVAPPYCNCNYQNFGGQPMRSRSAVAAAGRLGQ